MRDLVCLVDTDILIDVSRGNQYAIGFPVTESIGRRAYGLLKRYAGSHGLRTFDSLIAATALEEGCRLATMNRKHFGMIEDLILVVPRY